MPPRMLQMKTLHCKLCLTQLRLQLPLQPKPPPLVQTKHICTLVLTALAKSATLSMTQTIFSPACGWVINNSATLTTSLNLSSCPLATSSSCGSTSSGVTRLSSLAPAHVYQYLTFQHSSTLNSTRQAHSSTGRSDDRKASGTPRLSY